MDAPMTPSPMKPSVSIGFSFAITAAPCNCLGSLILLVMPGLVPGISLRKARPCQSNRDGRDKPGHDQRCYRARMRASTGSRYEMNRSGSSLMGKWPSPFMMVASAPVRRATSSVPSVVQE
jgi:hypothetical protein